MDYVPSYHDSKALLYSTSPRIQQPPLKTQHTALYLNRLSAVHEKMTCAGCQWHLRSQSSDKALRVEQKVESILGISTDDICRL